MTDRLFQVGRLHVSAGRWTLMEFLALVLVAAVTAQLAAMGSPALGVCLILFTLSTRVAVVDYSLVGAVATGLVMALGVPLIFLGTLWALY